MDANLKGVRRVLLKANGIDVMATRSLPWLIQNGDDIGNPSPLQECGRVPYQE